jgi:hypothetical protein
MQSQAHRGRIMTQAAFNFLTGRRDRLARHEPRLGAAQPAAVPPAAGLPAAPAPAAVDPGDAIGFDHARYAVVPPATCLWPGHPVREGWERGRRLIGRRARPATLAVSRWLALRLAAWQRGESFDDHQITPQALRSLEAATHCPISGRALGDDAQVVAVDAARGWVAGNLALLSPEVAVLWRRLDWPAAKAALARAEDDPQTLVEGLTARQWRRVVTLKSLATPLPSAEAARVPLHLLPPNRLRLANPIQELQLVLTLQLAVPGWGQRARGIAAAMPLLLRCEFNLFFNSLLAQALRQGAGPGRTGMRDALALAWNDAIVQRRWLRLARLVDDALARRLVDRLASERLPGVQVVRHEDEATLAA